MGAKAGCASPAHRHHARDFRAGGKRRRVGKTRGRSDDHGRLGRKPAGYVVGDRSDGGVRGGRRHPLAAPCHGIEAHSCHAAWRASDEGSIDASRLRDADDRRTRRASRHPAHGLGELGWGGAVGSTCTRRRARAQTRSICHRGRAIQSRDLLVPPACLVVASGDCSALRTSLRCGGDLARTRPRGVPRLPAAVRQACCRGRWPHRADGDGGVRTGAGGAPGHAHPSAEPAPVELAGGLRGRRVCRVCRPLRSSSAGRGSRSRRRGLRRRAGDMARPDVRTLHDLPRRSAGRTRERRGPGGRSGLQPARRRAETRPVAFRTDHPRATRW